MANELRATSREPVRFLVDQVPWVGYLTPDPPRVGSFFAYLMTPILLIIFGLGLIALTIWDSRRERADMFLWLDYLWWEVTKTENPILFRIALAIQYLVAILMIAIGVIWLVYFR